MKSYKVKFLIPNPEEFLVDWWYDDEYGYAKKEIESAPDLVDRKIMIYDEILEVKEQEYAVSRRWA